MRLSIFTAIFAAAIGAAAVGCDECCAVCLRQVGDGIADNSMLGNCWGNCGAYACGGRCPNEKYNP
ncbi:hypothetical protein PG984_000138 [Apiospora sp. TS-2023a]